MASTLRKTDDTLWAVEPPGTDLLSLLAISSSLDPEDVALLDAAREEFVNHGFRRAAISDIARRAKSSRPTVYRRLGDKDRIIRVVVLREVVNFFVRTAARLTKTESLAERVVEAFVSGITEFQTNPLGQAVLRHEPEALGSLVSKDSRNDFELVRNIVATQLIGTHLPQAEARRVTELILRITVSLLILRSDILPIETAEDARRFATKYFVPLIEAVGSSAAYP